MILKKESGNFGRYSLREIFDGSSDQHLNDYGSTIQEIMFKHQALIDASVLKEPTLPLSNKPAYKPTQERLREIENEIRSACDKWGIPIDTINLLASDALFSLKGQFDERVEQKRPLYVVPKKSLLTKVLEWLQW